MALKVQSLPMELGYLNNQIQDTSTRNKTLHFMINQFLEQSSIGNQKQRSLSAKANHIIQGDGNFSDKWFAIRKLLEQDRSYHAEQFDEYSQWFTTPEGKRFIEKDVRHMDTLQLKGLGRKNYVSAQMLGQDELNAMTQKFQSTKFGKNISIIGGESSQFFIQGEKQTSRIFTGQITIPGMNSTFNFRVFDPSQYGFVANPTNSTGGLGATSESIYGVGKSFIHDVTSEGKMVFSNSYMDLQLNMLNQVNEQVNLLRSNPRMRNNPRAIQDELDKIFKTYEQAMISQQHFAGSAAEMQNVGGINRNSFAKLISQQEATSVIPMFSQNKLMFSPNSKNLYKGMAEAGIVFPLSSGQVGNTVEHINGGLVLAPKGIRSNLAFDPIYDFPSYREPHKSLNIPTPILSMMEEKNIPGTNLPRIASVLPGAYREGASDFTRANFDPKGIQTVVTFVGNINSEAQPINIDLSKLADIYPDKSESELKAMAQSLKENFQGTNLYLPDGTILAKDSLARDAGVGYMRSEKIKLTGPGGSGGHQVGKSLAALIEGKTTTFRMGNQDIEFAVQGLKDAQGDMSKALQLKSFGGTAKQRQIMEGYLSNFGFPLAQGEYLGLDQQGRQVGSSNRANVLSFVNQADVLDENINLRLFQTTEQAFRDGRAVNQVNKFTGGALNKAKVSSNYVTAKQFGEITGLDKTLAEGAMQANKLGSSLERTYYQGGAAKFSLAQVFGELTRSGAIQSGSIESEVADAFRNMSVEDLLGLAHGQETKGFKYQSLSNDARDLMKQMLTPNMQNTSTEYKLASIVANASILGGANNAANINNTQKWIENIYSPHTNWGKSIGFGDEMEVFQEWGKGVKAKKVSKQTILNELENLTQTLLRQRNTFTPEKAKAMASLMLRSEQEILSALTLGITDEGTLLGMGQKATLEPRYFDLVKNQKYLTKRAKGWISPMEEVTSRMTNYIPAIEELNKVLSGYVPDNLVNISEYNKSNLIGRVPTGIDLGFSTEQLKNIEDTMEEMYGANKYSSLGGKVYMPSEEHLAAMGQMKGGLTLEKDKPIREVYSNFVNKIAEGKRTGASDKAFAGMFVDFQKEMQNLQKLQVVGEAGGGAHGLLRGPVSGSSVAYNLGYSGDLQEALGLLSDSEGRFQSKFYQTQRQAYYQNVLDQGAGRQVFMTEGTINSQFNDAINSYKQQMIAGKMDHGTGQALIGELENSLERLRSGYGVGSLLGRDPAINSGSITGATIYMDRASNYALDVDAISIPQQTAKMSINGGEMMEINYSILNEIAGDHDGDRIKAFALSRRNAEQISQHLTDNALSGELRAARTAAIKQTMVGSVKDVSSSLKMARGSVPADAATLIANEAQAQSSVKTVVPKISNAFSEMKFALSLSNVDTQNLDIGFNFLYSGEQVPISGKHFVEQTEFGDELVSRFRSIRRNFLDPEQYETAVKDMMGLLASDKDGNLLPDLDIEVDYRGQRYNTKVSYQQIQDDLVRAGKLLHSNEKNVEVLKKLRAKGQLEKMNQEELMGVYKQLGKNLEGVHFRANELENLVSHSPSNLGRNMSVNHLQNINRDIIESGAERASRGLTQSGILERMGKTNLAIAGGLLAVTGAAMGMMMSPTFVNKREQYIDPDFLFPEEFDKLDPNLHSKGLITPSAVVGDRGMNAQIHLPPGARIPENLAGRLAMMGENTVSSLNIYDHRMSLDANKIDKIKREII